MAQKFDIVYVLGNGSTWHNREIWFSLASVAKNLKNVGKVFVVGSDPGFLSKEVTYVHVQEMYDPKLNPAANIISKLLAVAKRGLADNFLLMNDDFVVLQPTDATQVPVVHKGKFSDYDKKYFSSGNYRLRMRKTFSILKERKLPDYNFGVHVPMPINTANMLRMLNGIDWKSGVGISFRTIYGNMFCVRGSIHQVKDPNVNSHHTEAQLQERFKDEPFMSYNDRGLNRSLKRFLQAQLPETHRYANGPLPEIPKREVNHKRLVG